ncbi:rRNA maturation RNase YbeY [Pararhodonellum marinum]|uniref:rRNA maturation RNase YbeY n=1 Tax=Pararhodonellum marinum TaxID=2755358 RepID=UPI00188FE617|nr:rRNA maturation RNase YbeY [Pararhodonellum marinum]
MPILFFEEDIKYQLPQKLKVKKWLREIAAIHGFWISNLNFIFCSDEYLYELNRDYLDHDTYTDIITFDNSENSKVIEGDVFISIDRVKENARNRNEVFEKELRRVLSHGVLHLCGFKDKTQKDSLKMREKEDFALSVFDSLN